MARFLVSRSDTIADIATKTHCTVVELEGILQEFVDKAQPSKCRPVMSETNGVARLVCSNCGSTLDVGAKYCSQCGCMVCEDDGQSE